MNKSTVYSLVLACLLIGSNSFAQQLGFRIINGQKKVRIPFELYSNLIVVPVILNNQLPLKFVLDTGVRTTILTQKAFSDILNLKYTKKYIIAGVGDEKDQGIEAYITNNVSLTLPGIKGLGHAMLVLEEDYLELRNYLGTDVHGVLGYEVFSRFIVKVDYDAKMLLLTTPEYFNPQRGYEAIPMSVEDTKPYIHAAIQYENNSDPIDLKLMIDSGASHGLLLDDDSDEALYIPEKNIECSLGRGLNGRLNGSIARLKKFQVGSKSWKDLLVTFPEGENLLDSLKSTDVFRNGSLGGELLSRFKVIFDYPGETLYIKKGKSFRKEFKYNLSGLEVKAKGSRLSTIEIVEVRQGSSGDIAGLKNGDILVEINNIPTNKLNLGIINGYLNSKENRKLRLTVLRDNKKVKALVKLKSQI